MRRLGFSAAPVLLLLLLTIPVCAQRRGVASPRMTPPRVGASVGVRPGQRIIVRGGFGFGHNPGFGVFFRPRHFHHRRVFINPFVNPFFNSFFSPFGFNSFPIYPYYPYGLQSDFVYSGGPAQAAPDYSASQTAALSNEVSRLQAEVDILRREQASQPERQQYALNAPTETPRPVPATPSRQEAPATVLVYRDGHRAEVRNYAIAGQTLWIFSEERARKVPLAELDLDATRRANEERGIEFSIRPAAPPSGHDVVPENSPSPREPRPQAPNHTARAFEQPPAK